MKIFYNYDSCLFFSLLFLKLLLLIVKFLIFETNCELISNIKGTSAIYLKLKNAFRKMRKDLFFFKKKEKYFY